MKKNKFLIIITVTLLLTSVLTTVPVRAATEEEIEQAIEQGIDWLASTQWTGDDSYPPDGGWGHPEEGERTSMTAFALTKLQDRAYELGYDSPFDPEYMYSEQVIMGWEYIFSTYVSKPKYAIKTKISLQDHTSAATESWDDPDTNGNGYGIKFYSEDSGDHHATYTTGVVLMALASTGTPDRQNEGMLDFNGDLSPDTYQEIAQDTLDWLAFAQGDSNEEQGAWGYSSIDNDVKEDPGWSPDNSNSGYASLGLFSGENFGCIVPQWVKTMLNTWINYIQNPVDGDSNDGGSGYTHPEDWVNTLKTGNLLLQMTLVGDDSSSTRFQNAIDYLERNWNEMNYEPGWIGNWQVDDDGDGYIDEDPRNWIDDDGDLKTDEDGTSSHYQAMFYITRGLRSQDVNLIDLDGDEVSEHNWYSEFAELLVSQQMWDGKWEDETWGNDIIDTCWALMVLEKEVERITVSVDVKPRSWPNPINLKSNGVVSIAICGTEDFDVTTIDPASVVVYSASTGQEVYPLRWSIEDEATPWLGDEGEGWKKGSDGYPDLVLKYDKKEMALNLNLYEYTDQVIPLMIQGYLTPENGGTEIKGKDYVRIQYKVKQITIGATGGNGVESIEVVSSIAREEINEYCLENNINYMFSFDIRDNQGNSEAALENTEYYHENDINLIVGHSWSSQCLASLPYANENGMLMLSPSSTSILLGSEPEHIGDALYRLVPPDSSQATILAQIYPLNGVERVSIIYRDGSWGQGLMENLVELCEAADIEVVGVHPASINPYPNMGAILDDVESELSGYPSATTAVQLFMFSGRAEDLISTLDAGSYPALKALEWYETETSSNPYYWMYDAHPFVADLTLYSPEFTVPDSPEYKAFNDKYYDARGFSCTAYETITYDSCWALAQAVINAKGDDAKKVKRELEDLLVDYEGISGTINLNVYGDRVGGLYDIWGFTPGGTYWKFGTYNNIEGLDWYGPPEARIVALNRGGWSPNAQLYQMLYDFPGFDWEVVEDVLHDYHLDGADMLIMVQSDLWWPYDDWEIDNVKDWLTEEDKTIWVTGDSDFGEDKERLANTNMVLEEIGNVLRVESCGVEDTVSNAGADYQVLGVSDNCDSEYEDLVIGVDVALFHGPGAVIAFDGSDYHEIESGYANVYTIMTTTSTGVINDHNTPAPEAHGDGETGSFVLMAIEEIPATNNRVIVTGEAPYNHYNGMYKPEIINPVLYTGNQQGATLFGNILNYVASLP